MVKHELELTRHTSTLLGASHTEDRRKKKEDSTNVSILGIHLLSQPCRPLRGVEGALVGEVAHLSACEAGLPSSVIGLSLTPSAVLSAGASLLESIPSGLVSVGTYWLLAVSVTVSLNFRAGGCGSHSLGTGPIPTRSYISKSEGLI